MPFAPGFGCVPQWRDGAASSAAAFSFCSKVISSPYFASILRHGSTLAHRQNVRFV